MRVPLRRGFPRSTSAVLTICSFQSTLMSFSFCIFHPAVGPTAGRQARPEAGATQERTLEGVAWTPWLGAVSSWLVHLKCMPLSGLEIQHRFAARQVGRHRDMVVGVQPLAVDLPKTIGDAHP